MTNCVLLPAPAGPPLRDLAAALPDERVPMLLDSGDQPGPLAAWSYLVFDPLEMLRLRAQSQPGARWPAALQQALQRCWPDAHPPEARPPDAGPAAGRAGTEAAATRPESGPAFRGGAVGYLGYDLARELERVPSLALPDADLPDLLMGLYPFALAEELATGRRVIVGRGSEPAARRLLREVVELGRRAQPVGRAALPSGPPRSTFDRAGYLRALQRVREHILDGDIYQVNLSQRFELPYSGRPEPLQAALRARFPAPFGALLRAPGVAVISSSPELFLRRRGTRLLCRPIKGTRPRGDDPATDRALQHELEISPKEQAELAMIVDLVRNDLGRSASIGSVTVELPFRTEAWSTVFHRVASVRCEVAAGSDPVSLLAAAFPPASVTGTPKLRSQQVIESLEPVRRHVYTGAIGWIGADGDLDLSVAIRIATLVQGRLLVPVGGGVTLLSEPGDEYEETLHKARAMFDVLGVAAAGVRA